MMIGAYEVTVSNGWSAPRAMGGGYDKLKFPDVAQITTRKKSELRDVFGVNPELLRTAAKSIGYDAHRESLYIHRDSTIGPILIAPEYQAGVPVPPFAMVMPLYLSGLPHEKKAKAA
jgi:hypothetical protein